VGLRIVAGAFAFREESESGDFFRNAKWVRPWAVRANMEAHQRNLPKKQTPYP
jgi:hypothetical protein